MNGYESLKAQAQELGVRVPDLLALARTNDPFFCGSPAQEATAQWFADLFCQFGFEQGVHLRRIHYKLVSQREQVLTHKGEPYENTEKAWHYLCAAGKAARTLGLVDVRDFVDQRNPDPRIFREPPPYINPSIGFDPLELSLGGIQSRITPPDLALPGPDVYGYDYSEANQPYLMEIWVEKSTVTDVLEPVARRFGMNLVISAGFQSITAAVNLIQRAQKAGKPARMFYISDFDSAGDRMPVAVSRQVEYWVKQFDLDADICITPLVLTLDQVIEYQLPRIPIKETDRRRTGFEERYGEGAVELDALEALHPGVLARLVRQATQSYWDMDLPSQADELADDVEQDVRELWDDETAPERAELSDLETEAAAIYNGYQDRLAALAETLNEETAPLRDRLSSVRLHLFDKQNTFNPPLPDRVESSLEPPNESAWLFDSKRGYMEQLSAYRGEAGR